MTPPPSELSERAAGGQTAAGIDAPVAAASAALLALGLLMIYSARIAADGGGAAYLVRQSAFAALGLGAAAVVLKVPLQWWRQSAGWFAGCAVLLLALTNFPPLAAANARDVSRWLDFGVATFQPAEFAKFALVLYAAGYGVKQAEKLRGARGVRALLPLVFVVGVVGVLLMRQPDFGSFVVIVAVVLAALFLAGLRLRYFFAALAAAIAACGLLIFDRSYRLQRFESVWWPFVDADNAGYQQSHALLAFGRGGLSGEGLGRSVEKWSHLPEAHTDFIAAIIAEELGLAGFAAMIFLYVVLISKAFRIARTAAYRGEYFGALATQGVGVLLGLHVFFNVGGNLALLPAKGITLPLVSYGGSSLLMTMLMIAFVLRVDRENRAGGVLP